MADQELFKGTAQYYSQYRAGYVPELFEYLVGYFDLNGKGRLLDLGCGTGQLTIPLAKYFTEVVGLDPEQEMLDEAWRQAQKLGIKNIVWVHDRAENLPESAGTFHLTTTGAAFHWMHQQEVLQKVYGHTKEGGGLVVVYDSAGSWATKNDRTEPWQQKIREVITKYLGEQRRAGNSFYKKPEGEFDDMIEGSPFGACETWTHGYTRTWTIESIIGFLYSTSFASRRLFGEKSKEFEDELKTELLKLEPSGIFIEQAETEAMVAKK